MSEASRILVVDDEPRNVKLISAHLRGDGFEPLSAFNGTEALQMAATEKPDVILLDILMPDLDGFEVTRRLKADPVTQHIPVVLVTSLDGSDNRVRGLDAGADEFLTKPVNRAELLVRVRALQRMKLMQDELQLRQRVVSQANHDPVDSSARPTVLIVEDDARLAKQVTDVLGTTGCQTVVASSAAVARDILAQQIPDLVLLDRILPDADGLTLLAEWKAHQHLHHVPVIIITALTDLEQKIEGIERGADDYLIKPVENSELQARVRAGLRRALSQKNLRQDVDRLQQVTVTDGLTGVRNRYFLDVDLEYRMAQSLRDKQREFSLVMLDIDHFKQVNDLFGHMTGDAVLRRVALLLQQTARTADIVTRYGGEEFCIVLPETDQKAAQMAAERLRQSIAEHHFEGISDDGELTASLGVATYCVDDKSVADLLARADVALYTAKAGGRNRVCMAAELRDPGTEEGAAREATP